MKLRLTYTIIRCDDDEDDFTLLHSLGTPRKRGLSAGVELLLELRASCLTCAFGRILANMYILFNCNYALFEPILDAVSSAL